MYFKDHPAVNNAKSLSTDSVYQYCYICEYGRGGITEDSSLLGCTAYLLPAICIVSVSDYYHTKQLLSAINKLWEDCTLDFALK